MIKISVKVDPKPKKRPKVYRWSTVNPSENDERELASIVINHPDCPKTPLEGQIRLLLKFYKKPPKATPKWKLPLMEEGIIRPNILPDLDNYVKLTLDALNGILWADDRFIVEIHSAKFYSNNPRIEIEMDTNPQVEFKKDVDIIKHQSDDLSKFF
ncbi:MAG: RusA family crossover junction endodeoxyribonuclease [Candidatus Heimdallarchaeota archaeon]|nr:RusA family crossover junction endodeoxyribonuclease [Candidatus Heimdallarchaeota archaeon]